MKILYLTRSQVGDRSFGGAMRANALRDALLALAEVDTLVIHGGATYSADPSWQPDRTRLARLSRYGLNAEALLQRRKLKRWVTGIVADGGYDYIVAQYLDLALLVPPASRSRMIFDPDDFRKTALDDAPAPLRMKLAVRNRVARQISRQAAHVWYSNPSKEQLPPTSRRSFLPNIIIAPDSARLRAAAVPDRLIMVGFFAHAPNAEGLAWFHDEVLPGLVARRPGVELHAIGRADPETRERMPNIVFSGFVDDLTVEYDRAALVVAPVLSGGGTQIKVIDALAHGRPLIASTFAHRGFAADLHADEHLLVAETATEWIERCEWALANPADAATMAERGEQAVRADYGPERLHALVAETLDTLSKG